MHPRTTGIVFLVAAALFAFVYIYEMRGAPGRQQAEEAAKRLFPNVEADDVEWIAMTTSDGTAARAERRDRGWELTEPLVFPGDMFALDGIASALALLSSEAKFENPQPLEVYGLDGEERAVRFGVGGEEFVLRTGDKSPVGANSYVAVGSDAVYVVATYRINALRKEIDDLRDKRILHFDNASVERVTATWPGSQVVLERQEQSWRLRVPLDAPADGNTVDALLSDLSFLRASGFVDEPPSDRKAGLRPPDFEVELLLKAENEGDPPRRLHLAVGQSLDGETRLVRSASPSMYRIAAERIGDFPRKLVSYRFRQLAKYASSDAQRLEIVFHPGGNQAVSAEPVTITATRGETGWTASPDPFKAGSLSSLVYELSRLRAEDILADSMGPDELQALELAPPAAVYRVFGEGDEKLAQVELGALRDDWIFARTEGHETVFKLESRFAQRIPVSFEAYRNRFVADADAEDDAPDSDADPASDLDVEDGDLLSPREESP